MSDKISSRDKDAINSKKIVKAKDSNMSQTSVPDLLTVSDIGNKDQSRSYPSIPKVEVSRKDINEISQDVWQHERKCLLMLLEARMILREMLEGKIDAMKPRIVPDVPVSGTSVELRRLLAINPDADDDDEDLSKQIAELRRQLAVQIRENQNVEKNLGEVERKTGLLIMNRSSIAELDRNAKKRRRKSTRDLWTMTVVSLVIRIE